MAKAIYTLKIGLFHEQFKLTKNEASAVKSMNKFVIKSYIKPWFLSQISLCVPRVDLGLLKIFAKEECYQHVLRKFINHLWYLNKELIALSLFDENVSILQKKEIMNATKTNIAQNEPPKKGNFNLANLEETDLHSFAITNTIRFFNILYLDYYFLEIDPLQWRGLKMMKMP